MALIRSLRNSSAGASGALRLYILLLMSLRGCHDGAENEKLDEEVVDELDTAAAAAAAATATVAAAAVVVADVVLVAAVD